MATKTAETPEPFDALELANLVAVSEADDDRGRKVVTVRSREARAPICCLGQKLVKMGRKAMRFRDFPRNRHPVVLLVNRQRWRCQTCDAVLYEALPDIDTKREMTVRLRDQLGWDAIDHSFSDAAKINGVTPSMARRVFLDLAEKTLSNYQFIMPRVLGIDEKVILGKARLVIGDVERRVLLDMQASRRTTDLDEYLGPMVDRGKVEVVCQDMWRGYATATRKHFPNAVTVIDKFHVVRLGDYGLSEARKSLFKDATNDERTLLKRRIGLLKTRWPTASLRARGDLEALFSRWPKLEAAYRVKEGLYGIYDAPDRAAGEELATEWIADASARFPVYFKEAISAFRGWRPHILRYFEHPFTNAYTERVNGLIAEMNTRGKGYDFETLRAKALLKHGSKTLRRADGSIPWEVMGPGDDDMEPGDMWVWTGAEISTLEADFRAGTFLP